MAGNSLKWLEWMDIQETVWNWLDWMEKAKLTGMDGKGYKVAVNRWK